MTNETTNVKLLILGGTIFLGRHLVEAALAREHDVTLFNRGQHNPDLYPMVEKLRGDRDGHLAPLQGRQWDAVIDTCGYVPRIVRASAELLASNVGHYTFISSASVYADFSVPGLDESAAAGALPDGAVEEVTSETYGPLKYLCEQAVERSMPDRALIIRPGLIVGPHDPTDRFTYWPRRVAQGGEVLAPGRPDRQVQFIDVRDLAEWIVRMVESGQTGVYNAAGPDYTLTMQGLLDECKAVTGGDAHFIWVGEQFLVEAGVAPWVEIPLWLPIEEVDATSIGFLALDCRKALTAGLSFRPLADTIRDTLAWDTARSATPAASSNYGFSLRRAGLKPEREADLLRAWRARQAPSVCYPGEPSS